MVPVALSEVIAVGEMPTAEGVAILAKAGFRAILNSQPEGEVQRHLTGESLEVVAKVHALGYAYVPAETRRPDEATISAFRRAARDLPKPIYACCYSGSRSAALWALAMASDADPDAIIKACRDAGYDVEFLREELTERRAGQVPTRIKVAEAQARQSAEWAALDAAQAQPSPVGTSPNGPSAGAPSAAAPSIVTQDTPPLENQSAASAKPVLLQNPIVQPRAASAGGFAVPG